MSFNLRPGTSLSGNVTLTPGTNENYVAPPIHGTISTSSTSLTYYAVSSDASDDNATNEGSVFIFNSSDGSLVKELNVAGIDLQRSQDRFGFELESYGTKIFIRSWGDDEAGSNVGAVFVFDADDLDADPVKLIPSPVVDPVNANTQFGTSIAVSDDKLFIGDSGSWDNYAGIVYVYDLSDLTAEPTTLTIGGDKDAFGKSLAISSGKLFVGASVANTVYVYDLSDLTAAPQSFTDPTLSNFGFELASNSSTVFVHSRHGTGFISVYDATDLSYITKLTISDGNYFGWDIAATEDYLCTGSLFMNKAFVYNLSDLTASPVELTVSGSSQLGYSAKAKDNTFIVGANEAAYVYDLTDLNAAPLVLTNDDGATGEFFGFYTALVYATSSGSDSTPEATPEAVVIDNSSKVTMLLDASVSGDDTVVDSSSNAHSVTINGDVSQSSFSPYRSGGYSQEFSTGYISKTADDDSFNFGSDDFTVEMWFNAGPQAANYPGLFSGSNYNVGGSASFRFDNVNYDQKVWLYINGVGDPAIVTTNTYAYYQWHHTALVRNGTNLSIYVNGVQDASITISASQNINFDAGEFRMGRGFDVDGGNGYFNGKIAGVRAVRGTAVYTSNFTVPTSSPTDIAGTELLTCHLPYVIDGSSNNHGLTLNGGVSSAGSTPYDRTGYSESLHGGSYVFDGSGDYLYSHDSSNAIGTQDFTLECWIYAKGNPSDQGIFESRSPGGPTDGFTLTAFSSSVIRIWCGGALVSSSGTNYVNEWTHLAVTRSSGTMTLYINGISQGSASTSFNLTNDEIIIGAGRYFDSNAAPSSFFNGNIADLRIVKGTAVYTTDFTPPTAPLTAVTGTSLLLAGTNASYRDQTQGVKSMSMEGNVAVESSSPFDGQRSLTFDGSGDRVVMESDALAFGTGDYTVEGWAYLDSVGYYKIIITTRPNNGGYADAFSVQVDYNTGQLFLYSNAFDMKSPSSVPVGQWFHYAVTRENSLTRMFLDGVEVASATIAKNYTRTLVGVGDFPVTMSEPWVGEIGEIRVTKGLARYTSDFTVPTGPLGQYTEAPNVAPTISGIDSSYDLSSGMDTVITGVATDLHNDPITWTYAVTSGSLGDTTVTQADNVFTVTPGTADATFQLTFTATDDNGNAATFVSDITHVYVEPTYVQSGLVFNLDATNYSGSGDWIDLTGNGGDATLTNGMSFDAANGGSFAIDGADDFAQFPSTALVSGNGAFTNEFWFKWSGASGPQVIFGYGNDVGPHVVNVATVTNNKFRFEFGSGAGITDSTTTINTGTWYHAVATYDQSSIKVYINGALETTTAYSSANVPLSGYGGENGSIGALFSTWGNVSAGGTKRYGTFGGNVAVARQYNRALDETEILFNYNASKDRY